MDDLDNAEAQTAKAMEIMGAEEEATETTPVKETEGAPDKPASAEGENETVEQEETPAIEPPALWKAELKARWKDIPADLQQVFAQQEQERNSGVGTKLAEAAKAREAAEQERQRFAQLADIARQSLAADPILAIAAKIGTPEWVKFAEEQPAQAYAQEKQVQARIAQIQMLDAERQRLAAEGVQKQIDEGHKQLERLIPEWKDEAKRGELKEGLRKAAIQYGFTEEEVSALTDPRSVVVLRKAMEYDRLVAAQKSAAEKQAQPTARRVLRPGSGEQAGRPTDRFKAAKSQFMRTGKESDQLNAILAAIGT